MTIPATEQDIPWMQAALELARQGIFSTAPNPHVGCVIVKGGEAIGKGFHVRAGEPHAEAHALREAGAAARGATAYVSLEPCAHQGRTPPCADALIAASAIRHGLTLVTRNTRDFADLQVPLFNPFGEI